MADKNIVKGRRMKSKHWAYQVGYVDPALLGGQPGADGLSAGGGPNAPLHPGLNHVQPTDTPAAITVSVPEGPGLALSETLQPMGPCNGNYEGLAVQNATAGKGCPTNAWGWDEKFAARVADLSIGTIDEYLEAVTPPGSYDERETPFSKSYPELQPVRSNAGTSPWRQIGPLDSSKILDLSLLSRSKVSFVCRQCYSGIRSPSVSNANTDRGDIAAKPSAEGAARAITGDKGLSSVGKPAVPAPIAPGLRTPLAKAGPIAASSQVRSDPIAIRQTNSSKKTTDRKLPHNAAPGKRRKWTPMILTSLLPEPRKYSIRPIEDEPQDGQVGYVVWVNNLSDCTTYEDLEALMKPFGPILKLKLAEERETGCWAFGYVHYEFQEDAARAIAELNGKAFDNAVLNVVWSHPPGKA